MASSENSTPSAFWASISEMLNANIESIWNAPLFSSTPSISNLFSVNFFEENIFKDL